MVCRVDSSNQSQVVQIWIMQFQERQSSPSNYLLLIWYESHSKVNLNKTLPLNALSLDKVSYNKIMSFIICLPNYLIFHLLETIIICNSPDVI